MKAPLAANLFFSLVLLFVLLAAGCKQEPAVVDFADSGWVFADAPTLSGKETTAISELAAAGWTITSASLSDIERIFGSDSSELTKFKSQIEAGDIVVRLVAPSSYWANSAGWDGYAIVRSGTVVATLVHTVS